MQELNFPITRRVLVEKTKNNLLFVYTLMNTDKRIKNPFVGISNQLKEGYRVAVENGLELVEYNESWLIYKKEHIVGRCMFNLLKLVIEGRAKRIYIRRVEMISKNSRLRKYILHLFAVYNVTLYTKGGRLPLEVLVITPELAREIDILIFEVNNLVPLPFEYVKN